MVLKRELNRREEVARTNLVQLWKEAKTAAGVNQYHINSSLGWTQSVFGQYVQGRLALNPSAVVKLAEYFRCYPEDIDPDLYGEFVRPAWMQGGRND